MPHPAFTPGARSANGPTHAQHRKYKRFDARNKSLTARVILTDTIELSNISTSGACIVTTKTLRPGDNILLKIPHEKVSTPLKCTIIWERANEESDAGIARPACHKAGVKFTDLSTDTLVQLKDFMRMTGVPCEKKLPDEYQPSPLRFRVVENNRAKLNYPADFPVRRISLGGMLVETTCDFEQEERHPMALLLPGDDRPLKFLGRVASRIPRNGFFDLGIEFMDMNAYDQGRLGMFLRTLTPAH
ncbi:MAG: hypothetical protein OHK006_10970 [Thermodesulfovibrionales bacterium]